MTSKPSHTDRRLTNDDRHDPLKAIAGQIQKLSYRDIKQLAAAMDSNASAQEQIDLVEMLLEAADTILNQPGNNPHGAKSEARFAS